MLSLPLSVVSRCFIFFLNRKSQAVAAAAVVWKEGPVDERGSRTPPRPGASILTASSHTPNYGRPHLREYIFFKYVFNEIKKKTHKLKIALLNLNLRASYLCMFSSASHCYTWAKY